jgi:riboflavin kinase/FMN adenylyltransferase
VRERLLSTAFLREELARFMPDRGSVISIGVFDGVHRGHRHLIGAVHERAREAGLTSGVLTFHPHPRLVLKRQSEPIYLLSLEERLDLLHHAGLDFVATVTFTSSLAQVAAREFVEVLAETLKLKRLVVGPGFALGRGREGNVERLEEFGADLGFHAETVPPLVEDGQVVSSTAVRNALAEGRVRDAAALLGRPFSLTGPVVLGDQRGRTIGFPTANIAIGADRWLTANGVYATRAYVGEAVFPSATNIGERPTFGVNTKTIEAHLIGFDGDLYGQELRIELVERLRPEQRFAGIDALKDQIHRDVARAAEILA